MTRVSNPYLEAASKYLNAHKIIDALCKEGRFEESGAFEQEYGGMANYSARRKFVGKYAWAIPNEEALSVIAKFAPIVEIGAGSGYWAYLLRERGVDIIAYDVHPLDSHAKENRWHTDHKPWTSVLQGAERSVKKHADRSLFLCWPPYSSDMASKALAAYKDNTVIYVGEGGGGCTADDAFHAELDSDWKQIEEVNIPHWEGVHDRLFVWRRL